jgi:hypothetical protein
MTIIFIFFSDFNYDIYFGMHKYMIITFGFSFFFQKKCLPKEKKKQLQNFFSVNSKKNVKFLEIFTKLWKAKN